MAPILSSSTTFLLSLLLCALAVFQGTWAAKVPTPTPQEAQEMLEAIKAAYYNITDDEAKMLFKVHVHHIQENIATGVTVDDAETHRLRRAMAACSPIPAPPSTNDVRNLHPGNIEILASMGDSITAGFGAKDTTVFSLKEYRELSWSIGYKSNTLFNLLKVYSPNLAGASNFIGTNLEDTNNGNNGAVSGAIVEDMPSQADWLIKRIRARDANADSKWKLITIWIGGNNLCKFSTCTNPDTMTSAANYKANLKTAIQKLLAMPKTLVNLVANMDITELGKFATTMCKVVHNVACPCGTSSTGSVLESIRARRLEYNAKMQELVKELNNEFYGARTDAGVAYQLFLTDTKIPDKSYLSSGDCFHPADKTHGFLATALWNSLITPTPQKKLQWKPEDNEQPVCATESTRVVVDLF